MTKNQRIFIFITIIAFILILSIISLIMSGKNNLSSDDAFVRQQLIYLDEGESDIEFVEVALYFDKDNAFLEIIYDYSYLSIERRTRLLVNRYTGQIVSGGYEDDFPDFMTDFNKIKMNYTRKKVYTMEDINRLINN